MLFTRVPVLLLLTAAIASGQVNNSPVTIATPATLLPAVVGVPYTQSLSATGGVPPYTWFLPTGTMPPGLTLSPSGLITGRLDATGSTDITLAVTDNTSATVAQTFTIAAIPRSQIRFGSLAHVAAGGWWDTSITLINTSSVPVAITAQFRADDSTAMSLPLRLTQQGAATQSATVSSMTAAINPNGTLVIATGALAASVVGWVEVLSSGPVSGFAVLRSSPPNDKPSEATVPLQTSFPSALTLPYDNSAGYVMGVALVNLAGAPANLTAKVLDEDGTIIGTPQILIPANGHTSFVLTDAVAVTAGKRGIIQLQSQSGGVSILGLRFSPAGPFTNVPVLSQQ
jgi:hypothetical protein